MYCRGRKAAEMATVTCIPRIPNCWLNGVPGRPDGGIDTGSHFLEVDGESDKDSLRIGEMHTDIPRGR